MAAQRLPGTQQEKTAGNGGLFGRNQSLPERLRTPFSCGFAVRPSRFLWKAFVGFCGKPSLFDEKAGGAVRARLLTGEVLQRLRPCRGGDGRFAAGTEKAPRGDARGTGNHAGYGGRGAQARRAFRGRRRKTSPVRRFGRRFGRRGAGFTSAPPFPQRQGRWRRGLRRFR